jgi:LysM repeat protein
VDDDDTPDHLVGVHAFEDCRGCRMNEPDQTAPAPGRTAAYRLGRGMLSTMPIVLAGTMAVTMNVTGSLPGTEHAHDEAAKPGASPAPATTFDLTAAYRNRVASPEPVVVEVDATIETASVAPTTYTVRQGDTVSSIAGRYGLSTASVLALNGLSWKSTIFPGQTLHLTAARSSAPQPAAHATTTTARPTAASIYTIVRGDTLSSIAAKHGVATQALLTANGLGWSSIVYPGQRLRVPGSAGSAAPTAHTAAAPVAATTPGRYVIRTGDTLASIAKAHATTVEKLLAANGLSWTSTIYAGRSLVIPGSATTQTASTGGTASAVSTSSLGAVSLDASQRANALTIIRVGRSLGVSDYGIVIALSAAAQESGLRNLAGGDRDSVGLFQQRPSQGWGSRAALLSTDHAARLFFGGSSNPNAGRTRGLLDIRGWSRMTVTQAAQAVQVSAYPTAYAKWERPARIWLASL